MSKLVVVESPTKARTIGQFLGKGYEVKSSYGHIRDLPKGKLGIDLEHDFEPQYVIPTKARKVVNQLKKEAAQAEETILATDEDREGEAISFHLKEALGLRDPRRIVFHEITKRAIEEALQAPRKIDENLVEAQQARRVLDRLVGYKLSPFLWRKVSRGLSAGRVQSVAVRLVADREKEIQAFQAQEYWSIVAALLKTANQASQITNEFEAGLAKKDGKAVGKLEIKNKEEADALAKDLEGAQYRVASVERKETKRNPLPPFTTSTLQQTAGTRLRYSAKQTMRLAQQLYEQGYVSYHRTDSLNLSESALEGASRYIARAYGKEYGEGRRFRTKSRGAQEAHEAIRPTYVERTPESQAKLTPQQRKLYDLVWRRFVASQMAPAVFDATSVEIGADRYAFRATGQVLKFDGFLKVYPMKFEETDLPELHEAEELTLRGLSALQHFTQPPPRYTEATLVKALEELGIGRPSTYAPILSTVQERGYVEKDEQKRLAPTELGGTVNTLLVEHFPAIVDVGFTAAMEEKLDEIAQGKAEWLPMIRAFYEPFSQTLERKYEEVEKHEADQEGLDKVCPECGAPLVVRLGRFGRFAACSTFPKCRHTEPLENQTLGIACPKCGAGELAARRTKRGKTFYGCGRYPECSFALWDKPTGETCVSCGSLLVEKRKKVQCSNPDCPSHTA